MNQPTLKVVAFSQTMLDDLALKYAVCNTEWNMLNIICFTKIIQNVFQDLILCIYKGLVLVYCIVLYCIVLVLYCNVFLKLVASKITILEIDPSYC